MKLVFGIITLVVSLVWVSHIISYFVIKTGSGSSATGPQGYAFLNELLLWLNKVNLSFLATGIFAFFSVYLLLCVVKGCIKFGTRFLLCIEIHPLEKAETYINSILFNLSLVLITSISVTQFCTSAFKEYASMTDIELIFSYQIKFLKFFKYFNQYYIFEYAFLGFCFLSAVYLILKPSDANSVEVRLKAKIKDDQLIE